MWQAISYLFDNGIIPIIVFMVSLFLSAFTLTYTLMMIIHQTPLGLSINGMYMLAIVSLVFIYSYFRFFTPLKWKEY